MTRYFYDCPLKAAYMKKYVGMEYSAEILALPTAYLVPHDYMFHPKLSKDETTLVNDKELHQAVCLTCHEDGDRYYLHQDSLHLLEPQVGDIVAGFEEVYIVSSDHHDYRIRSQFLMPQEASDGELRIIERDGKPFHWPESEEA